MPTTATASESADRVDLAPPPFSFMLVSQTIEKKRHMHCDFPGPGFFGKCKIIAMKDRISFIRGERRLIL